MIPLNNLSTMTKYEENDFLNLTSPLNHFNRGTNFQGIAIKVFMILPSLLLQKPSKTSKAKDHLKKLDERLAMWRTGKIDELLRECKTIQHKLITSKVRSNVDTATIRKINVSRENQRSC